LDIGTDKATLLAAIRDYLPRLDPQFEKDTWGEAHKSLTDGRVMCVLALTTWILTVAKEIRGTIDFARGFLNLPRGPRGHRMSCRDENGTIRFTAMSRRRKAYVCMLTLLRLSVAVFMLITGCMYLAYTSSMEDLLINAVALEVVLLVDELVFVATAPGRARHLISNAMPLELMPWRSWKGLDLHSGSVFPVLLILLIVVVSTTLNPHVTMMETAHDAMCKNLQNFGYATDKLGLVHLQKTNDFENYAVNNLAEKVVQEVVDGRSVFATFARSEFTIFSVSPSLLEVPSMSNQELTNQFYSYPRDIGCHNALDVGWEGNKQLLDRLLQSRFSAASETLRQQYSALISAQRQAWLYMVRFYAGNNAIESCAQLQNNCLAQTALNVNLFFLVTALCPKTCACNSLLGGSLGISGCPDACLKKPDQQERYERSCQDVTSDVGGAEWQAFLRWSEELDFYQGTSSHKQMAIHMGCSFSSYFPLICQPQGDTFLAKFSEGDSFFAKAWTQFCPVTCNCGGNISRDLYMPPASACPAACFPSMDAGQQHQ